MLSFLLTRTVPQRKECLQCRFASQFTPVARTGNHPKSSLVQTCYEELEKLTYDGISCNDCSFWTLLNCLNSIVPLFDWTAEELKGKAETEREGKREQIQSQDASKNTAFLSNG